MRVGYITTYFSKFYRGPMYYQMLELSKFIKVTSFASSEQSYQYTVGRQKEEQKDEILNPNWNMKRFDIAWKFKGFVYPKNLREVLGRENLNLIHSNEYYQPISWHGLKVARKMNIPFVFTQRGPGYPRSFGRAVQFALLNFISKRIVDQANHITSCTTLGKKYLMEKFKVKEEKITVITTSVDMNLFENRNGKKFREEHNIPQDAPLIMQIGRIFPIKRVDVLLRVFSEIQKENKDCYLVIVGPEHPQEAEKVRKLEKELNLKNVIYTGPVQNEKLPDVLAACDVFAQTSEYEGFSFSLLEASAARKPIMSFAVGGNVDIIQDGVNGYMPIWCDIKQYANRLLMLINDKNLRVRLGENAWRICKEKFSVEKCNQDYLRVYNSVI